ERPHGEDRDGGRRPAATRHASVAADAQRRVTGDSMDPSPRPPPRSGEGEQKDVFLPSPSRRGGGPRLRRIPVGGRGVGGAAWTSTARSPPWTARVFWIRW